MLPFKADRADRQLHCEGRSLSLSGTVRTHYTAMKLDQRLDDGEPHPESAAASRCRRVRLSKPLEQVREELRFNADAVVGHTNLHLRLDSLQLHLNKSILARKADGVREQV